MTDLLTKLRDRTAIIGVVGLGYVGLPLAKRFADVGFHVIGYDIDERRQREAVNAHQRIGKTDSPSTVAEADAIILCLPTPLGPHREPDLSCVRQAVNDLLPHLHAGQVISLESTTYPGTTREIAAIIESQTQLRVGDDIFLVYSPERIDPGNKRWHLETIPKIVSGMTPACRRVGMAMYEMVVNQAVSVSSPEAAEFAKLLENSYRFVNIGLVNEMKLLADRLGLDINEIIDAAATKPFGFQAFRPGPGIGGHCIPIDPFYLRWVATEHGVPTRFIDAAGEVDRLMPEYVVSKVVEALNRQHLAVMGAKVLMLGMAYKKNSADYRESPSPKVAAALRRLGADVCYADPHVSELIDNDGERWSAVPFGTPALAFADCTVLLTDHDAFDYEMILRESNVIVDTCGRWRAKDRKVIRA